MAEGTASQIHILCGEDCRAGGVGGIQRSIRETIEAHPYQRAER